MVAPVNFCVCSVEDNVTLKLGQFDKAGGQVFAPLTEILASEKF